MNKKNKQQGSIKLWLAILCIIAFWVWFFTLSPTEHYLSVLKSFWVKVGNPVQVDNETSLEENSKNNIDAECASMPPKHGQAVQLTDIKIKSKLHSRFYVVNEHIYPLLITFINEGSAEDLGAVYIHPNKSKQMNLPVGDYQLYIESGTDWCNFEDGFLDGAEIYSDKTVQIQANNVANLRVMSYGNTPSDAMLSFSDSLGVVSKKAGDIQGSGSLILQPVVGGNFTAEGSINGLPVNFLVDTGASLVAIPTNFAKQAGIISCDKKLRLNTANGITTACLAQARTLTIGQFTLRNIDVVYHEGLGNQFLLGMNVISQFKLEQQGDVMKMTR